MAHGAELGGPRRVLGGPDAVEARAYRWSLPSPRRTRLADFVPAFPHDSSQPMFRRRLDASGGPREPNDLLFWISFATLTRLLATTAPVGFTRAGLPIGIQIVGPYLEDRTTIDLAGRLAEVIGGFRAPAGSA
jgi:Asp-tRNA(Asn)/Glu-tRNA(Gln) amidotransferase A subunit family amidase